MRGTVQEKFDARYIPEPMSGCWLWMGAEYTTGYGYMYIGPQKRSLAHRLSWTLHRHPIPDGINVLHRCDNPACVNPGHLFLGTQLDNIEDMRRKGRAGCKPKFPAEVISEIKTSKDGITACARRLGVSIAHVHNIRNNKIRERRV